MTEQRETKYVYFFEEGESLRSASDPHSMRNTLGGKGAGLAEMTAAGLPVPSGFTITTQACLRFYEAGDAWPAGLQDQIDSAMRELESRTAKGFGQLENPLLVSVRSGARVSMPGMMDTILNLGLNDQTVASLARLTSNERFAWDAYRRFITMYSSVVLGIRKDLFEEQIDGKKKSLGVKTDSEVDAASWKAVVVNGSKRSCARRADAIFPRTFTSSSKARSMPFSIHGTPSAPSTTAASIRYRTTGVPPST